MSQFRKMGNLLVNFFNINKLLWHQTFLSKFHENGEKFRQHGGKTRKNEKYYHRAWYFVIKASLKNTIWFKYYSPAKYFHRKNLYIVLAYVMKEIISKKFRLVGFYNKTKIPAMKPCFYNKGSRDTVNCDFISVFVIPLLF